MSDCSVFCFVLSYQFKWFICLLCTQAFYLQIWKPVVYVDIWHWHSTMGYGYGTNNFPKLVLHNLHTFDIPSPIAAIPMSPACYCSICVFHHFLLFTIFARPLAVLYDLDTILGFVSSHCEFTQCHSNHFWCFLTYTYIWLIATLRLTSNFDYIAICIRVLRSKNWTQK
jgi:hypothetical protein